MCTYSRLSFSDRAVDRTVEWWVTPPLLCQAQWTSVVLVRPTKYFRWLSSTDNVALFRKARKVACKNKSDSSQGLAMHIKLGIDEQQVQLQEPWCVSEMVSQGTITSITLMNGALLLRVAIQSGDHLQQLFE